MIINIIGILEELHVFPEDDQEEKLLHDILAKICVSRHIFYRWWPKSEDWLGHWDIETSGISGAKVDASKLKLEIETMMADLRLTDSANAEMPSPNKATSLERGEIIGVALVLVSFCLAAAISAFYFAANANNCSAPLIEDAQ